MQLAIRVGRAMPFLLVTAVGIFLYHMANEFGYVARLGRAGPDLWPKILLWLMLLASIWGAIQALTSKVEDEEMSLMVRAATRAAGKEDEAEEELAAEAGHLESRHTWTALAAIVALLAFVGCIGYVGFTAATFAVMFTIMMLAGCGRPLTAALISLLGALAFFYVFQRVAYISLPLGVGPFKDFSTWLMTIVGVR